VKPEDIKELLVGNILSGALRPTAARQSQIGIVVAIALLLHGWAAP
jgi:hypothetical protein